VTPRSGTANEADLKAQLDELRRVLRPFVIGQVSTLPEGVLVLVSHDDLKEAKRVYMDCPLVEASAPTGDH
jgi:hypothetical protein